MTVTEYIIIAVSKLTFNFFSFFQVTFNSNNNNLHVNNYFYSIFHLFQFQYKSEKKIEMIFLYDSN